MMMRCTPCWTLLRQDEDTQVPIPTPGQSRHRRVCAEVGERDQRLFSIDAGADRFNSFGRKVCFFHGPWARLCFRILPRTFRLRPLFQAAFHFNSDALLPRRAWQRHAIGGSGDAPAPPPPGSRGRATRDGGPLKGRGVRHGRLSTLATLPLLWRPGWHPYIEGESGGGGGTGVAAGLCQFREVPPRNEFRRRIRNQPALANLPPARSRFRISRAFPPSQTSPPARYCLLPGSAAGSTPPPKCTSCPRPSSLSDLALTCLRTQPCRRLSAAVPPASRRGMPFQWVLKISEKKRAARRGVNIGYVF